MMLVLNILSYCDYVVINAWTCKGYYMCVACVKILCGSNWEDAYSVASSYDLIGE